MTQFDSADVPLIGGGEAPIKPFRLVVTSPATPDNPTGRREELFHAYAEADAGSLIALQRARNTQEQAFASAGLIFAAMVDDDGLSADYEPPAGEEDDEPAHEEPDDSESGEGEDTPATADVNGPVLDEDGIDLRYYDRAQWSSKRRFEDIMNDPQQRVRPDALTQLAELIIGGAAGRPTAKSAPSSHGPRRTRRG